MFGGLAHREFRLLWIGTVFSHVGWWMQNFALGWLVVQLAFKEGEPERAALYLGLVGLSRAVPGIALGLIAGALVDRAERRRLMLVTQSVSGSLALLLSLLTAIGAVNLGWVLLLSLSGGVMAVFDAPARQSALSRLVPPRDIMSAIGLQNIASFGTGVIGPALGGLLIGSIGNAGLFLINGLSYLPVLIALALMGPLPPVEGRLERSVLRSVREALGHVARDPMLRWVFIVGGVASTLCRPYLDLLPAFVANTLLRGPEELSLLLTITGVGSLLAAMLLAGAGRLKRRGLVFLLSSLAFGGLIVALAPQSTVNGSLVVAFGLGFASLAYMGVMSAIIQTTVPEQLLGRVVSLQVMNFMVLMPLGQLVLGALGTAVGVGPALAAGGAVTACVALYALWKVDALRRFGIPDPAVRLRESLAAAD